MKHQWIVSAQESGLKLIDFIKTHLEPSLSARHIKKMIESNACTVNGRGERFASTQVGRGDVIDFAPTEQRQAIRLDKTRIVYEDPDLLIVDKPSGFASDDPDFLASLQPWALGLLLVHRLDKETTGCLIFAKSTAVREKMIELFRRKKVNKSYLAIVDGVPTKKSGIIDNHLAKVHSYEGQALWGAVEPPQGQHARTEWQIERKGSQAALLVCRPITGRTHQIRVHLNGMGHPILGDHQYGRRFRSTCRPGRCMLHAHRLDFEHPVSHIGITAQAPIPEDMQRVIDEFIR